jgi:hypothetical protein
LATGQNGSEIANCWSGYQPRQKSAMTGKRQRLATGQNGSEIANCWSGYQPQQKSAATEISHDRENGSE